MSAALAVILATQTCAGCSSLVYLPGLDLQGGGDDGGGPGRVLLGLEGKVLTVRATDHGPVSFVDDPRS